MSAVAKAVAESFDRPHAITPVAVNRQVHSCWTDGRDLTLIFTDRVEMIVSWGNRHAELRGRRLLSDLPAVPVLQGPVSAILSGKTVDYCFLNDDEELVIKTRCGHEAVIGYDSEPVIRRMDVKVTPPGVALFPSLFGA